MNNLPEGFAFFGKGPVKRPDYTFLSNDIAFIGECGHWFTVCFGTNPSMTYALRIGSEVARLNGMK